MKWANNISMTPLEEKYVKMVRAVGCTCELPLLGYIPNQGPRCRICCVEAFEKTESMEEIKFEENLCLQ
jgi:hypothetical protein